MYGQNTSMVAANEQNKFLLPAMVGGDFNRDEIVEGADRLQVMGFQRVKIPAGGTLQFEVPTKDLDNPGYTRTLEGIILYNHSAYTPRPEDSEYDKDAKLLCSPANGKTGISVPGGAYTTYPASACGSTKDSGRGKTCKNMRHLYLLRSGEYMPLLVSLPPTSIRSFKELLNRAFVYRQRATHDSLTQISLKKDNNGGSDYSAATPRLLRDLQEEGLTQTRAYTNVLKEQVRAIGIQRALINEEQQINDCDYEILEPTIAAPTSDRSYAADEINDDYEQLPA